MYIPRLGRFSSWAARCYLRFNTSETLVGQQDLDKQVPHILPSGRRESPMKLPGYFVESVKDVYDPSLCRIISIYCIFYSLLEGNVLWWWREVCVGVEAIPGGRGKPWP